MRQDIRERCVRLGRYILRTGATVRQTAKQFHLSKSSVHKDVHERLRQVHPGLYEEVRAVLEKEGETVYEIGEIIDTPGKNEVIMNGRVF